MGPIRPGSGADPVALTRFGPCDNCGRPPDADEDLDQWGLLLLSPALPESSYQLVVCPRCSITLRAMLFAKWNGRKHSSDFRPYKAPPDHEDLEDDDDGDEDRDDRGAGAALPGVLAVVPARDP